MKRIIVLIGMLFTPVSSALAQEFLGTYKTDPEVFPGFVKPYPENFKKLIESMTWKMTITANGIVIEMNSPDSIDTPYQYTTEGPYLLAELAGSDVKKYVPFYMENSDTIHGFGTIFYRVD